MGTGKTCEPSCRSSKRRHILGKHIICPNLIGYKKCEDENCKYAHEYGSGVFDLFKDCYAVKQAKRARRKLERQAKSRKKKLQRQMEAQLKKQEEEKKTRRGRKN